MKVIQQTFQNLLHTQKKMLYKFSNRLFKELKNYMIKVTPYKQSFLEIIHRDIKPANILKSDGVFKLADFGFAVIENQYESIIKKFNVGTPMYMAPETIQCNVYSEKSDIWALGIVMYQILYKQLPMNSKQENDIEKRHSVLINKILTDNLTSKKTKELIINMLNLEPQKRYSINEIIQILNPSPKRLSSISHQNVSCKSIRSLPSPSLDLQSSRGLFDNTSLSKQQIIKSQPDEIVDQNLLLSKSQNIQDNQKLKIIKINQISYDLKINSNHNKALQASKDSQKTNTIQQTLKTIKLSDNLNLQAIGKFSKESPFKSREEYQTKRLQAQISNEFINTYDKGPYSLGDKTFLLKSSQISTNKTQTPLKTVQNNKACGITPDESECIQSNHQNSTNDTIKQNQLSNCLQIFQEKQNLQDNVLNQQNQPKSHFKIIKSPVRIIHSQQTIITPPFKSSGISEQKKSQTNNYIQNRGNSQESLQKLISNFSTEKVTTEFYRNKLEEKEEQLPANIRPTFKFLNYLNQIIKNFDNINTEDKQKCYFLLRKLLGIKATYVQKCNSQFKQELIQLWIDNFLSYYSKVENVFYTSPDRSFEQFFNKDLTQFSIGFSQLLLFYLQKILFIKQSKDIQIISEIISENVRQSNDPVLFARRWENDQP
ncbi:unnamed protein product [Paramecium sonneborni]|uniref:non-specific serine/threonine protein kinase n=1 Tax=Paramecium sonneborni TaxID=65129 RepID=A0A8S1KTB3_9CILI|nr:unnamed protein product [Paramecium sonneborni]